MPSTSPGSSEDPHGITEDDLATCFEVSNWDITAWKARFRSALRLPHLEPPGRQGRRPLLLGAEEGVRSEVWRRPHRPSLKHALLLAAVPPNRPSHGTPQKGKTARKQGGVGVGAGSAVLGYLCDLPSLVTGSQNDHFQKSGAASGGLSPIGLFTRLVVFEAPLDAYPLRLPAAPRTGPCRGNRL